MSPARQGGGRELALGLSVSATVLCLALVAAEAGLRAVAPVPDPYAAEKVVAQAPNQFIRSEFPRHYRLRTYTEAGLPGMTGATPRWFSTNNLGFRGDSLVQPKPPGEFRVFLVGGSTTECLYLDDAESIDHVVQLTLNARTPRTARVYNAGKSGDASDDHISMLVHRLVHLQPDLIVVFAGANDLTRALVGADPLHYVAGDSGARSWSSATQIRYLATDLQLFRRLYYLLKPLAPRSATQIQEQIFDRSDYAEKARLQRSTPRTEDFPRLNLAYYRRNLRTIAGVVKAHGIRLVLMTQQSSWNSPDRRLLDWHWMLARGGVTYREDLMAQALDSMNGVMREVAAESGAAIYDLARTLPGTAEYFYDDLHFNVNGARAAGEGLASVIASADPAPGRTAELGGPTNRLSGLALSPSTVYSTGLPSPAIPPAGAQLSPAAPAAR